MKWTVWILSALFLCASCATGRQTAGETAARVEKAVSEKHMTIAVDRMYPMGTGAVTVTSDFSLTLRGDTVVSHLPYFGRAYSAPYGGGNAFNFTAVMSDYTLEQKKDAREMTFNVKTDEDRFTFHLDIFDNGRVNIQVNAQQRQPVNYDGEMTW